MTALKTQSRSKAKAKPCPQEICDGKPHPGRLMSEDEFVVWCDDVTRAEWVDGEVTIMPPPTFQHASLCSWLACVLGWYVESVDFGTVLGSRFQVRLRDGKCRRMPDLKFLRRCHVGRIKYDHVDGPPDLVVEIVSRDSVSRDYRDKFAEYQSSGVKEYWIVNPLARKVEAHELVKGKYRPLAENAGVIHSRVLRGFYLRPAWLWQDRLLKVRDVLREMGIA